jgi:DNA-binding beta-propeller fold protein YncE
LSGGAPLGIAADAGRDRVWVTLTATNQLVEIEASERPRRLRTLPTVRQPNSVAVDERTGRVVVASATDDALQLLDP